LLRNPQGVKPTEIQLLEQANDGRKMRMWSRGGDVEWRWGCGMEVRMWSGGREIEGKKVKGGPSPGVQDYSE
jgi:hypothetical protein